MRRFLSWLAALTVVCAVPALLAGDWPQFRGPSSSGRVEEGNLPTEWSKEKNVAWVVEVPGVAWSSPIVWGDRLFLTTAVPEGEQEAPKKGLYFGGNRAEPRDQVYLWSVLCLDRATGNVLWEQVAHKGEPDTAIHLKNTYASHTPVTDGQHVYAFFGAAGLSCYDMSGELVWKRDFEPYQTRFGWGMASSPALDDQRIYIQYDNQENSYVLALDKVSGEEVWRADRDEKSSWSTPFLWETPQRTELVTCATQRVRSYDPSTGELLWELGGNSSIAVPTPVAAHGLLYVSSGYVMDKKRPLFAIRPGASDDITLGEDETSNEHIAWCQKQGGAYMPSPVVYGDYIYVLYDRGFLGCFDAKTGESAYETDRVRIEPGAMFTASPWAYDGKIFCLSEDGITYVIQAGPEFKILAKNPLEEMCMATPAIAGDSLYIRTLSHLFCIRKGSSIAAK